MAVYSEIKLLADNLVTIKERKSAVSFIFETLYDIKGQYDIDALFLFLGSLANVGGVDVNGAKRPRFFAFTNITPNINLLSAKDNQMFPYDKFEVPVHMEISNLCTNNFPIVPNCCEDLRSNEDRSDCWPLVSSKFLDDECQNGERIKMKLNQESVDVSQLERDEFDRFWTNLLKAIPYRTVPFDATVIPLAEFWRCFHALICGIPSWLFERQRNSMEQVHDVRVSGVGATVLRSLIVRGLELGNCCLEINDFLTLLEKEDFAKQRTLHAFRLGILSTVRIYEHRISQVFAETCGLVELNWKCNDIFSAFQQVLEICRAVRRHLNTKEFTVKWLLDFLFLACTECYFWPTSRTFLLNLFVHTIQPHLQWLNFWLTDIPSVYETETEEFFIELDKEAVQASDRTFWTDAIRPCTERVPNVFGSIAKSVLWIAKMNCFLHRRGGYQGWKFDDHIGPYTFDLLPNDESVTITLDTILSNIKEKVQERMNSIKSDTSVGTDQLWSICLDLRSIFLFTDGDFSSIIVEEIFDQLLRARSFDMTDSSNVVDSFDAYSLNRSLERALLSKTLSKTAKGLRWSFGLRPTTVYSPGYMWTMDCIQLDCRIPWPQNIVFTDSVVESYQKIFAVFLKLRLSMWASAQARNRLLLRVDREQSLRRHRLLMRLREIDMFTMNLGTYLLYQVLDISWRSLTKEVERIVGKDDILDGMYDTHNAYLADMSERCLLNPKAKVLSMAVEKLLNYATEFGILALCYQEEPCEYDDKKMNALYERFQRSLRLFYSVLHKLATRGYHTYLNDLLLRMNMNNYYEITNDITV